MSSFFDNNILKTLKLVLSLNIFIFIYFFLSTIVKKLKRKFSIVVNKKDILKYINQIERSGFFIQDFEFIETKNLSKVEYLPAICCSLRKPIEKVNIDQIINRIFDSL